MSRAGATTVGGLVASSGVTAVLTASPWLWVASIAALVAVVVLVWSPIAILLTTPIWSDSVARNDRAVAMIDRLLRVVPFDRRVPIPTSDESPDADRRRSSSDQTCRARLRRALARRG
jgi:hypothetical protein